MDIQNIPNYSITRFFWLFTGLFPEETRVHVRVQNCFILICILSMTFAQCGMLITHEFNNAYCMKIAIYIMPNIVYLVKYATFIIYSDQFQRILDWIQYDWNNYSRKEEQEIMTKHTKNGKSIVVVFAIVIYMSVAAFIVSPYMPRFLNTVMVVNETYLYKLPIPVEYFVDPDKYFHLILLHLDVCQILGASVVIATESTILMGVQHACGLFDLVSYHVHVTVEDTILLYKEQLLIRDRIKTVAQIHYRAISFTNLINISLTRHYMVLLSIGVLSLILNLYIVAQTLLYTGNSEELLVSAVLVICDLFYVYCCTYMGQQIINQCHDVFLKTYDTRWYLAPLPVQKFLVLLLNWCKKSSCIFTGGIIIASFETLLSIISTSMSYFTVLWSIK